MHQIYFRMISLEEACLVEKGGEKEGLKGVVGGSKGSVVFSVKGDSRALSTGHSEQPGCCVLEAAQLCILCTQ